MDMNDLPEKSENFYTSETAKNNKLLKDTQTELPILAENMEISEMPEIIEAATSVQSIEKIETEKTENNDMVEKLDLNDLSVKSENFETLEATVKSKNNELSKETEYENTTVVENIKIGEMSEKFKIIEQTKNLEIEEKCETENTEVIHVTEKKVKPPPKPNQTKLAKNTPGNKGRAPEASCRINFLYQAAHNLLSKSNVKSDKSCKSLMEFSSRRILATHLTHLQVGIGRKAVLRSSVDIKRTICKGCHLILIPGQTSTTKVSRKGQKKKLKKFVTTCLQCGSQKRIPITPRIKASKM